MASVGGTSVNHQYFIKATDARPNVWKMDSRVRNEWAFGYLEQQRFSLTAPAQAQRRVLSVACVRPAGFKIVPGKLIVRAEQHWKPQRSCFYSILEAWATIKSLISIIMNQHGNLKVMHFCHLQWRSLQTTVKRRGLISWHALVNVLLRRILPLDGIDTLYCVAPPSDNRPPSMQRMSFIDKK